MASPRTDRSRRLSQTREFAAGRGVTGLDRAANLEVERRASSGEPSFPPPAGPWRLTRRLGHSGRLAVYRARPHTALGPGCYAIKTLHGDARHDPLGRALLAREAAVAASVNHPAVSPVLSAHPSDEWPHLVLPYLEGATLRQVLDALRSEQSGFYAALTPRFALAIARQVAAGIAGLHTAGWLHGQVRPEHVIVSPQGHATLIDLTLARRLESTECDAGVFSLQEVPYAAPEALCSERCTAASDVYSLGILLFELLTGQMPFETANPRDLARLHRSQAAPSIRSIVPRASLELNELVRRMLAKQPLRRPSDGELMRWLAEVEIAELL